LKRTFNAEVEIIESHGGVYEITIDGELYFSKKATGHFPNEDRLLKELES